MHQGAVKFVIIPQETKTVGGKSYHRYVIAGVLITEEPMDGFDEVHVLDLGHRVAEAGTLRSEDIIASIKALPKRMPSVHVHDVQSVMDRLREV